MSKLYDVISRLEDVASQGENEPGTALPELIVEQSKERSPWLKVLLLTLMFIVLGLLIIGASAWLQKWFTEQQLHSSQTKSTIVTPEPTQTVSQDIPPPVSTKLSDTSPSSQMNIDTVKLIQKTSESPQQIATKIIEQFQDTLSVDVASQDITVETLDQFLEAGIFDLPQFLESSSLRRATIFIRDLEIAEVIADNPTEIEIEEYVYQDNTTIGDLKAKSSRWLHQAELYRHNNEWEGAIRLYHRVWDIYHDPAVANNLAAALIEVNKPEEAHKILQEAIVSTPNDPDIEQNLRIVEMILAQ